MASSGSTGNVAVRPGSPPKELVGMVLVDKEQGWTSHDVVARTRRLLGQRRVGHAGTLDPDATGLLLVGIGRFTRALRFFEGLTKVYRCEVVLGTSTDTLDASGKVTGTWDMASISLDDMREAARKMTGEIEQIPPMFSAVKVGGERLYAKARRGESIERKSRRVVVNSFEVFEPSESGIFPVSVACSTGTYVRSLAADLGTALGGGAHLRNLRRTNIGSFSVDEARMVDSISEGSILTPAQALRDIEQVHVDGEVASLARRRMPLDRVSTGVQTAGPYALLDDDGRLIAVYEGTSTDKIVVGLAI